MDCEETLCNILATKVINSCQHLNLPNKFHIFEIIFYLWTQRSKCLICIHVDWIKCLFSIWKKKKIFSIWAHVVCNTFNNLCLGLFEQCYLNFVFLFCYANIRQHCFLFVLVWHETLSSQLLEGVVLWMPNELSFCSLKHSYFSFSKMVLWKFIWIWMKWCT